MELKEQSKTIFNFNLNKNHIKLKMYHNKENPVPFLKNKHITKLIKFSGMKLDTSIFDINTHCKKNKNIIVNRYILLKK